MNEIESRIVSKAIARVSKRPQLSRTAAGFPVCRFTVATKARHPGENPVIMPIYVFGGPSEAQRKLAERCAHLRIGELVQATGVQRQRVRVTKAVDGKHWRENALQALDVQLLGDDGRPVKRSAAVREGLLRGLVVNLTQSPYEVYIGRGKDPFTGERPEVDWGNRFSHRDSKFEIVRVETAEEAVACHRAELWEEIQRGELSLERLAALAGKTLGCYCKPGCCHGDTLADASVWAVEELARRRAGC
jgi:Domain of unknown function (DUF4326)